MKEVGEDEHVSALLLGVRGIEAMRRWPPGVEGMGVRRCTRIVGALAPGVRGGARSLGPDVGVGVVARDMVEMFRCGGESEEDVSVLEGDYIYPGET